jgi:hypothetical protein
MTTATISTIQVLLGRSDLKDAMFIEFTGRGGRWLGQGSENAKAMRV